MDELTDFAEFEHKVLSRLVAGQKEYGDGSFRVSSLALLDEIEQELLDINGWSYIMYRRLKKLRAALTRLETEAKLEDYALREEAGEEGGRGHRATGEDSKR